MAMLWRFLAVCAALFAISAHARAQTVPPAPTPVPDAVVEEPHDIQVGDVIMAPRIEQTEDDDSPERERPPAKSQPRRWYGGPILLADGLGYGSIVLAVEVHDAAGVALPLGLGTFLLAGPIIHATHRQWGRMGLSLAARTVLPLVGLIAGASSCTSDADCSSALVGLTVGGMLAASIIDASALAYEPVVKPPALQPLVSFNQDRLWLGAGGTF